MLRRGSVATGWWAEKIGNDAVSLVAVAGTLGCLAGKVAEKRVCSLETRNRFQRITHQRRGERKIQQIEPQLKFCNLGRAGFRFSCYVLDLKRNGHTVPQVFFEQPQIKSVNNF